MNHSETVLLAHLTDVTSLDVLAREGFMVEEVLAIIPTTLIRKITKWALDVYFEAQRTVGPSKDAIMETWADELEQAEIEIDTETETDSIMWAVEQLRAQHVTWKSQEFAVTLAKDITSADPMDRATVVQEKAYELYQLAQAISSRRGEMDMLDGMQDALRRYQERAATGHITRGMTFGMPLVDEHTFGIHPREVAVVAAGSGVGKSWFAIKVLLAEWEASRKASLWTLENPMEAVFDRMACMSASVSYARWQRGECKPDEIEAVEEMIVRISDSSNRPVVIHPRKGERTVISMMRKSTVDNSDSIIIDQLSHITPPKESRRHAPREQVSAIMYEMQETLGESQNPMSCMVLHQINREGKKESKSTGRYVMEHLAESSAIERAVDFIFTIYQSQDDWAINEAVLQMLKGRRVPVKMWRMAYDLSRGDIRAREEIPLVA